MPDPPLGTAASGSAAVNTPLAIRSPYEPVSTCTLLMVWQVLVPGTQTVTLTVGMLMTFATPVPTVIAAVFDAVAATGVALGLAGNVPLFELDELELLLLLPPPPPHAAISDTNATVAATCAHPLSLAANCMARLPSVTVSGCRNR